MYICEFCNKECNITYGSNRFCNKKCASAFSTKEKRKDINLRLKRIRKFIKCKNKDCNNFANIQLDGSGKYCSKHKFVMSKNVNFEDLRKDSTRKNRLIKEFGRKCFECGLTEWNDKPAPLQLDHIDGNVNNNLKSNLRILCANCHAQTSTFCGKNIGNNLVVRKRWRS